MDRTLPAMDHTSGAVGSQYHPALGAEICRRIADGQTIRQIVADPDMPAYATLFHWRKVHPSFGRMYRAAREEIAASELRRRVEVETWKPFWRAHRARLGLGRGWVSGRRSTYERKVARALCRRIAAGEALYRVTADPAMPSAKAVYGWLRREPEFRAMYAQAAEVRRLGLEFEIDRVLDRLEDGPATPEGLRSAKRAVARLEGRIGRLTPKLYRDRG